MAETARSNSRWYLACGFAGFALLVIVEAVEPLLDPDKSYTTWRFAAMAMSALAALVFLGQWLSHRGRV